MKKSRKVFSIVVEPRDQLYRLLIDTAVTFCSTFLVVVRDASELSENAKRVLDSLRLFLVEEKSASEWPGTILHYGRTATVSRYKLIDSSASILKDAVDRLYGWQHPDLPEDVCIFREDESPWLVTIAHESDGYFELTESEYFELVRRIPELGEMVRVDVPGLN